VNDQIIAIVDDDALVRQSVQRLVRSMGFRADQYSSTEEFLGSASLPDVCCIISDVNLANGKASRLQAHLASIGYDLPVVFMTARKDRSVEAKLMQAGAIHVLAKPFSQDEMARCIAAALQRNSRARPEAALTSSS